MFESLLIFGLAKIKNVVLRIQRCSDQIRKIIDPVPLRLLINANVTFYSICTTWCTSIAPDHEYKVFGCSPNVHSIQLLSSSGLESAVAVFASEHRNSHGVIICCASRWPVSVSFCTEPINHCYRQADIKNRHCSTNGDAIAHLKRKKIIHYVINYKSIEFKYIKQF